MSVFSETDALKCLGRLAVAFGDSKIADARQRKLLAVEWTEAFAFHEPERVQDAISKHIRNCKFWPAIAEILDNIRAELPKAELPSMPQHRAEEGFGVNRSVEEIARRVADCKRWRQQSSFGSAPDPLIELRQGKQEPRGASQEPTVGWHLLNSCAAKRARGEKTCEFNCSRKPEGCAHVKKQMEAA